MIHRLYRDSSEETKREKTYNPSFPAAKYVRGDDVKNSGMSRENGKKRTCRNDSDKADLLRGFTMGLLVFGGAAAILLIAFFL